MLSKENKIITQRDIKSTLKTKLKSFNPYFTLFLKKPTSNNSKFLISVSKKIYKQAVKRNKIKRKFEGLILNSKLNLKNPNLNIFIVIKNKEILTLENQLFMNICFKTFKSFDLTFDMPRELSGRAVA